MWKLTTGQAGGAGMLDGRAAAGHPVSQPVPGHAARHITQQHIESSPAIR